MVSETLSAPAWSPDRRRFAIAKAHDGVAALSIIEADGSDDPRTGSAGEAKLPCCAPLIGVVEAGPQTQGRLVASAISRSMPCARSAYEGTFA